MEIVRRQPVLVAVVAFVVGLIIGLVVLGWGLFPVQWTGGGPQHLSATDQATYLQALADLYSYEPANTARINEALGRWPEADQATCDLAAVATDPAVASRLIAMAAVLNGRGCDNLIGPAAPGGGGEEADGGRGGLGNLLLICGLLLLLILIVGAIFAIMRQRGAGGDSRPTYADVPTEGPMVQAGAAEQAVTPIARFQTTYVRGHDTYDDSFSIENADGDFLGECGVGLSEAIGADMPKNVTAFEVWLFDKNDIRTVTKVIMSDHAFFDEAIKAKLAPKGEPVLARPNETVALETASLIINAQIVEMEYGEGTLPPQSFFDRFTVELSAWAKEGDFGDPDVQGRIDEMLEF
jgi:hypothetical protein